ncbi:MAG: tyrosine-type recombinase/integrase, partial [Proteobacteria bacterium]|nr:tyrosine-type recombinase/integrase [Pseudomonadota bacterium]
VQHIWMQPWRNLKNYLGRAKEAWGDRIVKDIQYGDIEDFLLAQDLSPKTRNNIKSALNSFWNWLRKRRLIKVEDIPEFPEVRFELRFRKLVDKETQRKILDEVKRISYEVNPKIWLGIKWLSTYVNVRPGELIQIKEGDILLDQGMILIPHPKEKKPKPVVLLDEDVELLSRFPRALPRVPFFRHHGNRNRSRAGQPFGDKYFWKWWKKACSNLGIEGVDLYGGTRHSSATALQEYFSPEEIKEATMHGTNTAFQRYFRTDIRRLKAVYEKANGGKDEQKEAGKVVEGEFGAG